MVRFGASRTTVPASSAAVVATAGQREARAIGAPRRPHPADGTATRWMFTEITPRSFHWLGDALTPDGKTWRREAEFLATRAA